MHGVLCAGPADTLIRLSKYLDDLRWEQALESALRMGMQLDGFLEMLDRRPTAKTVDRRRIDRVLSLRPPGAAPTGSYLETCMVQLCREIPGLPPPLRQYVVTNEHGIFVARVDLAWDDLGMFSELDGQQHIGQPVHDARREAAVVAATGWLVVRKTYYEVIRVHARLPGRSPKSPARPVAAASSSRDPDSGALVVARGRVMSSRATTKAPERPIEGRPGAAGGGSGRRVAFRRRCGRG